MLDHSIVIYLLAPNGEFLDFYTQRATVSLSLVLESQRHVSLYLESTAPLVTTVVANHLDLANHTVVRKKRANVRTAYVPLAP